MLVDLHYITCVFVLVFKVLVREDGKFYQILYLELVQEWTWKLLLAMLVVINIPYIW